MADQFADLTFPVAGVEQDAAVGAQRPGTTQQGINVRAMDPRTRRLRGGSRPGLSRYVNARPGGLNSVIQHLALIVDSDEGSLLASDNADPTGGVPSGWIQDPSTQIDGFPDGGDQDDPDFRNPGRPIPDGGSGVVPDKHTDGPTGDSDVGWEFVQKHEEQFSFSAGGSRTDQATYDSPTEDNQLLVVVYWTASDDDGAVDYEPNFAVSDSLGNTYTEAKVFSYNSVPGSGAEVLGVWWTRNTIAGNCTVSVQQTNTRPGGTFVGGASLLVLEYRGLLTSTPENGSVEDGYTIENDGSNPTGTISPGAVPITGNDRLVLAAFTFSNFSPPTPVPLAGYTLRHNNDGLVLIEKLSSLSSETPSIDYDNSALPLNGHDICAIGAGFRYS